MVVTAFTTLIMFVVVIGFSIAIRGHYKKAINNFIKYSKEKPKVTADFAIKHCQSGSCEQFVINYAKARTKTAGNCGIVLSIFYVALQILALIIFFIKGPHLCGSDA